MKTLVVSFTGSGNAANALPGFVVAFHCYRGQLQAIAFRLPVHRWRGKTYCRQTGFKQKLAIAFNADPELYTVNLFS